ncbi:MAG: GIY-YIG nuclease family protein [Bacteroidota bacterium]|nr:GIY-YIG nuclease family protein [Bacteroidota bacterium]
MSRSYVYILKCSDGTYYTGSTKNLWQRRQEHHEGEAANYTRRRRPVVLVYYDVFERIDDAFEREKQIQGWRREKKKALINGEQERLPELAKKVAKGNR